ncbi:hypothetical protein BV98_003550 [Sphingobium herbicidovorans NBRC 16415]|uniref:Uncharacterized protein n=1 Tax=Sphingobium herbicidovorans (strain ATCC 700291 / DSM 11019 / CCUG 56400 / KCTC 2939 / LMG 18315 / NBRC 16415 / MH) TaxID=1219045 RepID=A0A086P5P6_SPHHM|nr:hypothetical protein BV98_003550 [Sphingobium herbicidovorans NBRC 16415]
MQHSALHPPPDHYHCPFALIPSKPPAEPVETPSPPPHPALNTGRAP